LIAKAKGGETGELPRSIDNHPLSTPLKVAITLHYRYHARAGAAIDAGESVADTGKVDGYRYYLS
jgi:hypothetical protein